MKPTVTATAAMVTDSDKAIIQLLKMKEEAIKKTAYWQMYVGGVVAGTGINGINITMVISMKGFLKVSVMKSNSPWPKLLIISATPSNNG